jgi:hypothetical protein
VGAGGFIDRGARARSSYNGKPSDRAIGRHCRCVRFGRRRDRARIRTRRAVPPDRYIVDPTIEYHRSVAARILLKSSSHTGVHAEDRAYLTTLVRTHTGISAPQADDRVNSVMAESKDELHHARAAAVMQAFLLAAALLVGAAAAWFAAAEGGRDRERGTIPVWNWSLHNRRP